MLIDGRHAFPTPFIDWYYTAIHLKVGGRIIVDDTYLRSCRILNEFLLAEEGRWECEKRFMFSSVFRKISEGVHSQEWHRQPWGSKKRYGWIVRSQMLKNKIKYRMRKIFRL